MLSCIGRGATGGVYRARTAESLVGFAREVCIKRLAGQLSADGERAMREEARLLASVRHANVVSLLAMGQEPSGAPFLVLELIDGADLRVLQKAVARQSDPEGPAGVLPDKVALYVGCALVRALGAVQRAMPGLVHRDVTPHNVLVSREGEVKLTDFGIALALDRARWTMPTVVKGKWGYMAPEQIRGEPLDARSDCSPWASSSSSSSRENVHGSRRKGRWTSCARSSGAKSHRSSSAGLGSSGRSPW